MRNPTAKTLAMRDPALASLMGALAIGGADFGADTFGGDGTWGWEDDVHGDFGDDAPAAPGAMPTKAQAMQAWTDQQQARKLGKQRQQLLYPNKGSDLKIEGYQFALSAALTIGTANTNISITANPSAAIRPRRMSMNAPDPGFVTFTQLQVANVNTCLGGTFDAYIYNANGQGQGVSYPTCEPQYSIIFTGAYTGHVPLGYTANEAFRFVIDIKGPANMAG